MSSWCLGISMDWLGMCSDRICPRVGPKFMGQVTNSQKPWQTMLSSFPQHLSCTKRQTVTLIRVLCHGEGDGRASAWQICCNGLEAQRLAAALLKSESNSLYVGSVARQIFIIMSAITWQKIQAQQYGEYTQVLYSLQQ